MDTDHLLRPVIWQGDHILLLDQRRLPHTEEWVRIAGVPEAVEAIRDLIVRGAPAIGITAAYACVLSARQHAGKPPDRALLAWHADCDRLLQARPTAVNLRWALNSMRACLDDIIAAKEPGRGFDREIIDRLQQHATDLQAQDIAANRELARLGGNLIEPDSTVLTCCNTGALATGGIGTALGVIVHAHHLGLLRQVYATETRPWLQGSRLTEWELHRAGIDCRIIIDAAVTWLFASSAVDWLIVGADRVAANGDVANKIGTCQAMLAARSHAVKNMVVAPWSTVDLTTPGGAAIDIEQRDADEVLAFGGHHIARAGAAAWNPVFDITPADLVDYLVTERGVVQRPDKDSLAALAADSS